MFYHWATQMISSRVVSYLQEMMNKKIEEKLMSKLVRLDRDFSSQRLFVTETFRQKIPGVQPGRSWIPGPVLNFSYLFFHVLSSSSLSLFLCHDTTIHPLNMQMQKQEILATEKNPAESATSGNLSGVVCGGENGAGGDGGL